MEATAAEQLILKELSEVKKMLFEMQAEKQQKTYTVNDVAKALNCHPLTIRNRIKSQNPAVKITAKKSGHNYIITAKEFARLTTIN